MLADGTLLLSELVIGTIGMQQNALLGTLGLPLDQGRLKVTPELRVEGSETNWAVGDCACVRDADAHRFHPATAQVAVQRGHQLARNIAAGSPAARRSRSAIVTNVLRTRLSFGGPDVGGRLHGSCRLR